MRLEVQGEEGKKLQVIAEVLRIERNPGHPLAALQLLGETDEWRGLIWEPAAPRVFAPQSLQSEEDDDDEDDEELNQLRGSDYDNDPDDYTGSTKGANFLVITLASHMTLAIEDESLKESIGLGEPGDISVGGCPRAQSSRLSKR